MTRRQSRREIEHRLDDLTPTDESNLPDEFVIQYEVVGSDGETVVDTFEKVIEFDQ